MTNNYSSISVIYGSQTGNAEWIASHIAHQATERGYSSTTSTLDEFIATNLALTSLLIIVISTTGDGDPPDNATKFWRWFRRAKKTEVESFKGRKYALLGLGDTNYSNFCNSAKRVDRKLTDLGAEPILPKGLADDATGLEAVVEKWIDNLFQILPNFVIIDEEKKKLFDAKVAIGEINANAGLLTLKSNNEDRKEEEASVKIVKEETKITIAHTNIQDTKLNTSVSFSAKVFNLPQEIFESTKAVKGLAKLPTEFLKVIPSQLKKKPNQSTKNFLSLILSKELPSTVGPSITAPTSGKITRVKKLTGNLSEKKIIQLEIDLSSGTMSEVEKLSPGDAVGIICPNSDELVLGVLKKLNLDPEEVFEIQYMDNASDKGSVQMLAECSSDETEKKWLLILSSVQGTSTLKSFREKNANLLDILTTFPNSTPNFGRLVENLLKLHPRYYSLISKNDTSKTITIGFNVSEFEDGFSRQLRGLCTGWLDDVTNKSNNREWEVLTSEVVIPIFPKLTNDFKFPINFKKLLLVTAGTGIMPFISFLEHVKKLKKEEQPEVWLLYGARYCGTEGDVCFENYLNDLKSELRSFSLNLCLSRQSEGDGYFKGYVQKFINCNANDVFNFINGDDGGCIYVCGSMNMAKDLNAALIDIINDQKLDVNGVEFLSRLTESKRYVREIWG
ncbi:hypothetical protein HK099_004432 [Clydaea vesicula]|uniref:Methionine synthase reductase n=1 Tax=Clydaea vesicula TaxID=447962 RepID=A0AAD5XY85_9FUNG|nr:hypothetical protein HK099_004432 [Clydaea vesicula]